MRTILELRNGYWTRVQRNITDMEGIPQGWIEAEPPSVGGGMRAFYDGGSWVFREIEEYTPDIAAQITNAPTDLFGGPTLKDVFNGN